VQPVVRFHHYAPAIFQVGNPDPGAQRQNIAGSGEFILAENLSIGSFLAMELIAIKTCLTVENLFCFF
jgi:hypothetical protein